MLQVNQVATAAVGFMVHGDALITQTAGAAAAAADLLSEVQTSLNQLSAFTFHSSAAHANNKGFSSQALKQLLPLQHAPQPATPPPAATALTASVPQRVRRLVPHMAASVSDAASYLPSQGLATAKDSQQASMQEGLFAPPQLLRMVQSSPPPASVGLLPSDQWAHMQPELLGSILQQVKWTGREAIALTAVCRLVPF